MKLWLDDLRKAPFGWERVKTADECIAMLEGGKVEELSLDHDLHEEHYAPSSGYSEALRAYKEKTGFAVVEWMIATNTFPPVIFIHSLNETAPARMLAAIRKHAPNVRCEVKPALGFAE